MEVVKEIVHPYFDEYTLENDIMIVKLSAEVANTDIDLVGLAGPDIQASLQAGDPLTVMGFGDTEAGGSPPEKLQYVSVPYVDAETCSEAYFNTYLIPEVMICAGDTVNGGIGRLQIYNEVGRECTDISEGLFTSF